MASGPQATSTERGLYLVHNGPVHADGSLHALTWLVWALAAAVCVELAPSPVYVAVVIGVCWLVVAAHGRGDGLSRAFPALLALGVVFAFVRIGLTVATTHTSPATHVLFTTPALTLPRIVGGFTVGGTVELGVLLQAAAESFTIVGVMAVFGAFNAVVSHHELVRTAPRAFYEPGLIVTIAVAFVPSTMATVQRVREADRARTGGVTVRRGRLLRLAVPVLETGMEQAMALAESMDSRGFGAADAGTVEQAAGWCVAAGLLALAGSFVALVGRASVVAGISAAIGVAGLAAGAVLASRAAARPRYRRRRLPSGERLLMAACLVPPVAVALLAAAGDSSLTWSATPLAVPRFSLLVGLALIALAAPALRSGSVAAAPA